VILDTSAILSILFREPERDEFLRRIGAQAVVGVGAPALVEAGIVVGARLGERGQRQLERFVEHGDVVVIGFETGHWRVACEAWLRFGRGRHEAQLNLGDCLAYATARVSGRPLLAKGADFAKTDLALA
jgi:ribonuclease VapC